MVRVGEAEGPCGEERGKVVVMCGCEIGSIDRPRSQASRSKPSKGISSRPCVKPESKPSKQPCIPPNNIPSKQRL